MKILFFLLAGLLTMSPCYSQKNMTVQTANLNLSKSNINRIIYPSTVLSPEKAMGLLADLEKEKHIDEAAIKMWVASNIKRYAVPIDQDVQINVFTTRSYEDCTICKKNCKGRCVQDPGADCVCVSHSEPNLRIQQTGPVHSVIFISTTYVDDEMALNVITNTLAAFKAGKPKNKDQE